MLAETWGTQGLFCKRLGGGGGEGAVGTKEKISRFQMSRGWHFCHSDPSLSFALSVCLSQSLCLSILLSIHHLLLSDCPSISLYNLLVSLTQLYISMFCLCCLSMCVCLRLSIYLSVCLSICLSSQGGTPDFK